MVPFITLLVVFAVLALLHRMRRFSRRYSLADAAAWSLGVTLLVTASAHFGPLRADLVRMVPPALPRPDLLVTFTGVLEVLGAVGLFVPRTRVFAGLALAMLFMALLPANIHAAQAGVTLGGRPPTPLWLRIPQQLVYVVFALAPAISARRVRTLRAAGTNRTL